MIKGNVFEPAAARCSAPLLMRIICSNNNIDNGAKKNLLTSPKDRSESPKCMCDYGRLKGEWEP